MPKRFSSLCKEMIPNLIIKTYIQKINTSRETKVHNKTKRKHNNN